MRETEFSSRAVRGGGESLVVHGGERLEGVAVDGVVRVGNVGALRIWAARADNASFALSTRRLSSDALVVGVVEGRRVGGPGGSKGKRGV